VLLASEHPFAVLRHHNSERMHTDFDYQSCRINATRSSCSSQYLDEAHLARSREPPRSKDENY
jgi:hypothetical protein